MLAVVAVVLVDLLQLELAVQAVAVLVVFYQV
jgi:hypothetical protein